MAFLAAPVLATSPTQPTASAVLIAQLLPPVSPVLTTAFMAAPVFTALSTAGTVGYPI